jgi:hypothetical protein
MTSPYYREALLQKQEQEKMDQRDILYAMELRFTERESEAQQEFQSLVDELKNRNLEEKHTLSAQKKIVLDELWDKFQKVCTYEFFVILCNVAP